MAITGYRPYMPKKNYVIAAVAYTRLATRACPSYRDTLIRKITCFLRALDL